MSNSPQPPLDPKQLSIHGVLLDVLGTGVLLTGVSGIGKSELALGLINRGHCLIADDSVILTDNNNKIIGSCSPVLQDFLEVRGLGIINIRAMFGDSAIKLKKQLQLIVNILNVSQEELQSIDRLHGMHRYKVLLNTEIPEVSLPVAPGRSMAVLIEAAVRNHVLKQTGYHASEEFSKRQRDFIAQNTEQTRGAS